jgi:hypothetical protein
VGNDTAVASTFILNYRDLIPFSINSETVILYRLSACADMLPTEHNTTRSSFVLTVEERTGDADKLCQKQISEVFTYKTS